MLAPSKGVQEFDSPDWCIPCLQIVKYSLKTERNTFEVIDVNWHLVDCSSESSDHEERLQDGVHVTSGAFVNDTIMAGFHLIFLRSFAF